MSVFIFSYPYSNHNTDDGLLVVAQRIYICTFRFSHYFFRVKWYMCFCVTICYMKYHIWFFKCSQVYFCAMNCIYLNNYTQYIDLNWSKYNQEKKIKNVSLWKGFYGESSLLFYKEWFGMTKGLKTHLKHFESQCTPTG